MLLKHCVILPAQGKHKFNYETADGKGQAIEARLCEFFLNKKWDLRQFAGQGERRSAIFANPGARRLIGEYALKGEYLELAETIGVTNELGIEIDDEEE